MEKIYLGEIDDTSTQLLEGSLPKFWVQLDGKDYLFKNNFSFNINGETEFPTDVGEVLYSRLGKSLGIPCVNASFASYIKNDEEIRGVLVESYYKGDCEFSVNYTEMLTDLETSSLFASSANVETAVDVAKRYSKLHHYSINLRKTSAQLKKQSILDFFLEQEDRSICNVGFIANCDNLRLAPVFDNGFCLSFANEQYVNRAVLRRIKKGESINDVLHYNHFGLKPVNATASEKERMHALQIWEEVDASRSADRFVGKILDLDIDRELSQLETCRGVPLKKVYKQTANALFERKKDLFLARQNSHEMKI